MKNYEEFLIDMYKYDLCIPDVEDGKLKRLYFYANGCGRKGGVKFPSSFLWVDIESACIIHDIEWHIARNYTELVEANENFDDNLKKICDMESNCITRPIRRFLVSRYVDAVELYGTPQEANIRGFLRGVPYE